MKIALVYDRVNKFGGAEQVLLALHSIWPDAPLYSAVYNPQSALWAKPIRVIPSFLNSFPLAKRHHEIYPWVTPLAFESFLFDQYDVVLSITSADAKCVITKPGTLHICYCLTPTRYLWSGFDTYKKFPGLGPLSSVGKGLLKYSVDTLRNWDLIGSARPDIYVAISELVKQRIQTYYNRSVSEVIYPPVNTDIYVPSTLEAPSHLPDDYFLVVSRLVGYKRIDLIIEAFNKLKLPLIIVGDGHDRKKLHKLAGKTISFIHHKLTDEKLTEYYQHCKAFVFAAEEDFGIVAAEAQSCGKPVIAYKNSGVSEIVEDKKTGVLFNEQHSDSLVEAIEYFQQHIFDPLDCRNRALQFSRTSFQQRMKIFVEEAYNHYLL